MIAINGTVLACSELLCTAQMADKPQNAHAGIDTSNETKLSFSALRILREHHVPTLWLFTLFTPSMMDSMIVRQFMPSK
jgi:hypothetical protein